MTLNEFLDTYVPQVLRPMEGWTADTGAIRLVILDGRGSIACCPLTAEARLYAGCAEGQRLRLGLSDRDGMAIMNAADGEPGSVRRRLLAGLGLATFGRRDEDVPAELGGEA